MIGVAFTIVLAFVMALVPTGARADIAGPASVIDGDTIEIGGQKVRLHGIDAPESAQMCIAESQWRCGEQAARALDKKIAGRAVTCAERGRDKDGLILAVCSAGGEDLNAWLVYAGWALAYRQISTDYVPEEQAARAARRGVWRGSILAPWDWRTRHKVGEQSVNERMQMAQPPSEDGPRTITIRAANNGHFYVDAVADGKSIQLIVDTGATWVSLSRGDAERIGLDMKRLAFVHRMQTANGVARAASVTLRALRIGPVGVFDVEALVIDGDVGQSLLGLSFLSRLQSYAVSGSALTLTGY